MSTRDRIPPVPGSFNIIVDERDGDEAVARAVATAFAVEDAEWPPLWSKARSLVAQTVRELQNRGAASKQPPITDYMVAKEATS